MSLVLEENDKAGGSLALDGGIRNSDSEMEYGQFVQDSVGPLRGGAPVLLCVPAAASVGYRLEVVRQAGVKLCV